MVIVDCAIFYIYIAYSIVRYFRLVSNENNRVSLLVKLIKETHNLNSRFRIQRTCRFVGKQYTWIGDKSSGNSHTLALPTRKFSRLMMHAVGKLYALKSLYRTIATFCYRDTCIC